jgi:hypothetical protein
LVIINLVVPFGAAARFTRIKRLSVTSKPQVR